MTELDRLYAWILAVGFIILRQARDAGDLAWIDAEIQGLHNVPTLIGETNVLRHQYYWFEERPAYLRWVAAPGRERQSSRMKTHYEPFWNEMEPIVLAMYTEPPRPA